MDGIVQEEVGGIGGGRGLAGDLLEITFGVLKLRPPGEADEVPVETAPFEGLDLVRPFKVFEKFLVGEEQEGGEGVDLRDYAPLFLGKDTDLVIPFQLEGDEMGRLIVAKEDPVLMEWQVQEIHSR